MITSNLQEFYHQLKGDLPILAIDYGEKKVGIAISDSNHTIAFPLQIINEPDDQIKIMAISKLLLLHSVGALVIGLPINMNGTLSQQTNMVKKFAEEVSQRVNLPVYLQDERLTTKAANNFLKSVGLNRKKRNAVDDLVAASMILESTLNSLELLKSRPDMLPEM